MIGALRIVQQTGQAIVRWMAGQPERPAAPGAVLADFSNPLQE